MKNRNTTNFLALLFIVISTHWGYSKNVTYNPPTKRPTTIVAPTITATGNLTYCPLSQTKIVSTVTITHDIADPTTQAVYIQIASGYVYGTDQLLLTNTAAHPNITASWNATEGKLTLSSPIAGTAVNYSEFEAAIKDVAYYNSSLNPSGTRNFSISLGNGQANYLPRNGHYYEYVPNLGITWSSAKTAAALKTFYGLQGYLATLTAADEAQLAGKQAPGTGWIGGTDEAVEGVWRWVTGPEGLANGGAGVVFWNGTANGSSPNFAFWNTGEPNQNGDEDYAHITAPGIGIPGSWNDLSNTGASSGSYQPKGYIVEYGGMPGDPTLQLSASTTLSIGGQITATTPGSNCGPGSVTLRAIASSGTINWYSTNTGGAVLGTGTSYTTPTLSSTTSFYVATSDCTERTEIKATILPLPNYPSSTTSVSYCLNEIAIPLVATADTNNTLNWYTVASGGTPSATSPTPMTTSSGITKFYVSQINTLTGCKGNRAEITVTVNSLPTAPSVTAISYCLNSTATPLSATASVNCTLNWFSVASGGTRSATSPTPTTTSAGITKFYVSQTNALTGCEGNRAEITVTVNSLPTAPSVTAISYCLNSTAIPLTATADTNNTLNWYTVTSAGTPSATSPTPTTTSVGTTKYYVSQTNTLTGCEGPRAEITVTVNALPTVNDITITQCDTDLISDGKTSFNLTVNNSLISSNYANETFNYYTSLNGAINDITTDLITNELDFQNTTPTSMDIWTRVSNSYGCHSISKITLKVPATNFHPLSNFTYTICDDFLDTNGNNSSNNNNRDGISTFDFSSTRATILSQLPSNTQNYTINYYKNQADALAQTNAITNISNYRNIGYPTTQNIWIRIETDLDNNCVGVGPYITLNVEALPVAHPVTIPRICDVNHNGIGVFTTSSLESTLLNGQANVTVRYLDQNNNPLRDSNGVLITSPFPANFSTSSQSIKAIVSNNSTQQCSDETIISFFVDNSPTASTIPTTLTTVCDDEIDPSLQDGKFAFNTTSFQSTILGGQTGMNVTYYDQNNNLLASPLPNPFVTGTQNVTAVVKNPLNPNCSTSITIPFVVHSLPNIELNATELICSNIPTFFVTLDAGFLDNSIVNNFNYNWKKDGINLNITNPTLGVNKEGNYTVEVTNQAGCSRTRTVQVTASNSATITSVDIVDLVDTNTVTINTTGPGDYEYSMDYLNGVWQDSNFFNNVPGGIHQVFVNDKNGCGLVSKEITVLSIPKFFTPNNDSYNDFWIVKGMESYPNSELRIFDRYGKLLKELTPNSVGWDGTFNGHELPASDYWFVFKLDATSTEKRGHFSLKR